MFRRRRRYLDELHGASRVLGPVAYVLPLVPIEAGGTLHEDRAGAGTLVVEAAVPRVRHEHREAVLGGGAHHAHLATAGQERLRGGRVQQQEQCGEWREVAHC